MDFEIPESMVNVLLEMIESESPLAKRLSEHGVCHGRMIVNSKLFDAKAMNTSSTSTCRGCSTGRSAPCRAGVDRDRGTSSGGGRLPRNC